MSRRDESFEINFGDTNVDFEKTALGRDKRRRNDQRLSTSEIVAMVSVSAAAFRVAV